MSGFCLFLGFLSFRFLQGIGSTNTLLRGFYCKSLILRNSFFGASFDCYITETLRLLSLFIT